LGDQLLGDFGLANDLLRCVPGAFHDGVPGPVWPYEDSHSPWTDFRGPHHLSSRISLRILVISSLSDVLRGPVSEGPRA
jgi:hypothetical protein